MQTKTFWIFSTLFFGLVLPYCSLAQNKQTIDSLQKVIPTLTNQQKVDAYNQIAQEYRNSDSTQVVQYTQKAINISEKINYPAGIANAFYVIGWINMKKGNYQIADNYYQKSLKVSRKGQYDKGEANAYNGTGVNYWYQSNYSKAIAYLQKGLEIFQKIGNQKGIANTYNNMGILFYAQGKYNEALKNYEEAINAYRELSKPQLIANVYNNQGLIYSLLGNYNDALTVYKKSLYTREKIGDKGGMVYSYNNLGITYEKQGKLIEALNLYLKSLKVNQEIGDKKAIGNSLNNISNVYFWQENLPKALDFQLKALKVRKELGNKGDLADSYNNLANIVLAQRKFDQASKFFVQALDIRQKIGDKSGIAKSHLSIGELYLKKNQHKQAVEYFKKALAMRTALGEKDLTAFAWVKLGKAYYFQKNYSDAIQHLKTGIRLSNQMGSPRIARDGNLYLAKSYNQIGEFQKAYETLNLHKQLADSLLNRKTIQKVTRLEEQFYAQKREDSLKLKQTKLQATINEQRLTQRTTLVGLGLSIALAITLLVFYRSKQRSNQKLNSTNEALADANQGLSLFNDELIIANDIIQNAHEELTAVNDALAEKNKGIMDSINYAQRIQQAILPLEERIQQALPHHFIFFRPLDVVSGDFYWFEEIDNKQFIVVGDCTGHGVPGAFMTMLGTQALSNIVVQKQIHLPGDILLNLHKTLQELLKIENTDVQDGMDVVVCVIDKHNQILEYAGAKNPLVIIQNGKLEHIRGDRFGINGYHLSAQEVCFKTHQFDISIPTSFYMYSDGYQDQFGGPHQKKFMKKQLNELLLKVHDLPTEEQRQILESTLDQWIGNQAQIDDILVVGVQV